MFDLISIFPFSFWVVMGVMAWGLIAAGAQIQRGVGIPMLIVLGTVGVWYLGDAFYNDYANYHAKLFTSGVLSNAWLEVALFLGVFIACAPILHDRINWRHLKRRSGVMAIYRQGIDQPIYQRQLAQLLHGALILWGILGVIAAIRLQGEVVHYFFPFIGYKAEPWGRGRMGGGFDALLTLAFYFQLMTAALFGVCAALLTSARLRWTALLFCGIAWPYFLLDRTRNTMLAVVVPAILCWAILRVRGGVLKKGLILGGCFVLINAWMAFVIANRSDMTMMQALQSKGFHLSEESKVHHEGLNMYEELCWINTFIENGSYRPNWGTRYFAELVNPIPRVLWPGKPLIGIDYAIARGQAGGTGGEAGVNATVSTGMIGQGVVNFGRVLGPVAAALLMGLWTAALARLDLHISEIGRLPLYACSSILTFNLGRDITFITIYPFIFGALAIWLYERYGRKPRVPHGGAPAGAPGLRPGGVYHAMRPAEPASRPQTIRPPGLPPGVRIQLPPK